MSTEPSIMECSYFMGSENSFRLLSVFFIEIAVDTNYYGLDFNCPPKNVLKA